MYACSVRSHSLVNAETHFRAKTYLLSPRFSNLAMNCRDHRQWETRRPDVTIKNFPGRFDIVVEIRGAGHRRAKDDETHF